MSSRGRVLGLNFMPVNSKKTARESGCGPSPAALPLWRSLISETLSDLGRQPSFSFQPTL